ncbi:MAG: hypothetical protein WCS31_03180 [Verrucomicrobiae bacterium]
MKNLFALQNFIATRAALVFVAIFILLFPAQGADTNKNATNVLVGTNPKGDLIEWADGTVWTNVTIEDIDFDRTQSKPQPVLKIKDGPKGMEAGERRDRFRAIGLRSSAPVTAKVSNPLPLQKARDQSDKPLLTDLPKLARAESWADMCATKWLSEWNGRFAQPENSLKATLKGLSVPVYIQTRVTIPVVRFDGDTLYALVRNTGGNAGIVDGWFSGIETLIFGRELIEPKKKPNK